VTETHTSDANGILPRVRRFLQKPWHEKAETLRIRLVGIQEKWKGTSSNIRMPVRLPFGAWWVPRNDNLGEPLLAGTFETSELAFVGRFLRPSMTVLDLGAHQGLYTLLASGRVGSRGRVIAFEPSPRERRALRLHVMMNLCWNVTIQGLALGNENTEANLFVVEGSQTGCNSLRPPHVFGGASPIRVRVARLDDWLDSKKIDHVDFIKLDVEGAELEVLRGAERLLNRKPLPVILAEVQDVRTQQWGYKAKEIIEHLSQRGYTWLRLTKNGSPERLELSADKFEGNFVAVPQERSAEVEEMTENGFCS
jgi:FkbM family methyltransferase